MLQRYASLYCWRVAYVRFFRRLTLSRIGIHKATQRMVFQMHNILSQKLYDAISGRRADALGQMNVQRRRK